jgi:putative methionine-R-sulfoxide reductase with GAF domain
MVTKRTKTEEIIVEGTKTEEVVVEEAVGTPMGLVRVITEGAADARTAASNATQAAGKAARKTIYSGFYYVTYGVVYSTLFVGSLIPSNNAMGEGVHDGAAAARKDFDARGQQAEMTPPPAEASAAPA